MSYKALVVLFVLPLVACSSQTSPTPKLDQLREAIQRKSNPESFEAWHESLDEVSELSFTELADVDERTICEGMSSWTNAELDGASEFLLSRPDLSCAEDLLQRADNFIRETSSAIQSASTLGLTPCQPGTQRRTLGPSLPVVLNTTGGKKMVTGDLAKCQIAFTFDDGPSAAYTATLHDILKKQNVTANFFMVGKNVDRLPGLVMQTLASGHIWGNHSMTHANLPKLSNAGGLEEIRKGFLSLLQLRSPVPPLFRFPYGAWTQYLRGELNKRDVAEFFWNMDSLDWKYTNPATLYKNVLNEIEREKRGIILFHDVHSQTIQVVPKILEDLRRANYQTVFFVAERNINKF